MAAVRLPKPEVVITQPWLEISIFIMKFSTFKYSDILRTAALSNWNRKLIRDVSGCRVENWDDIITTPPTILRFNMKFGMPMDASWLCQWRLQVKIETRSIIWIYGGRLFCQNWKHLKLSRDIYDIWYTQRCRKSEVTGTIKLETKSWYAAVAAAVLNKKASIHWQDSAPPISGGT